MKVAVIAFIVLAHVVLVAWASVERTPQSWQFYPAESNDAYGFLLETGSGVVYRAMVDGSVELVIDPILIDHSGE